VEQDALVLWYGSRCRRVLSEGQLQGFAVREGFGGGKVSGRKGIRKSDPHKESA